MKPFIVALTASNSDDMENRRRCLDSGMDEVLTKPINTDEIK